MFRKFHRLGGEYAIDREAFPAAELRKWQAGHVARFRFPDGDGMMMPIKTESAIERIEAARKAS